MPTDKKLPNFTESVVPYKRFNARKRRKKTQIKFYKIIMITNILYDCENWVTTQEIRFKYEAGSRDEVLAIRKMLEVRG